MKKPVRSAKAPAISSGSQSEQINKAGQVVPEISDTASRQDVRQDVHRTNVPRQSPRPNERSNQHRSRKA